MSITTNQDLSDIVDEEKLSTGIDELDKEVLKGIPKGSTIGIVAGPETSGEMILYALATTNRETTYLTTTRRSEHVKQSILNYASHKSKKDTVEENLDVKDVVSNATGFSDIIKRNMSNNNENNVIIDSFSNRRGDSDFQPTARTIYNKTKKCDGITYLHFVADSISQLSREEQEILHMIDGVFNLQKDTNSEGDVENELEISKLRGVNTPDETQTVRFGNIATISNTDDIG